MTPLISQFCTTSPQLGAFVACKLSSNLGLAASSSSSQVAEGVFVATDFVRPSQSVAVLSGLEDRPTTEPATKWSMILGYAGYHLAYCIVGRIIWCGWLDGVHIN